MRLIVFESIRHPPRPSSDGPIIIYLPRGPLGPPQAINPLSLLAFSSSATVVRVDYRFSAQQPYPAPIHDVLAGYDWIKKHLGGITPPVNPTSFVGGRRKLGVCGELIGGSLAAMLALTECHLGKQGISAAALGNPVSDWTALFLEIQSASSVNQSTRRDKASSAHQLNSSASASITNDSPTMQSLLTLRKKLFRKQEHFFDPFASPMLYFRNPSFDLPIELPSYLAKLSTPDISISDTDSSEATTKKRRSHRKYPPLSSGLRLPKVRVELGNDSILKSQGMELAELMQRSIDVWENDGGRYTNHTEGRERIQLVQKEGFGLWDDKAMTGIGNWFVQAFQSS